MRRAMAIVDRQLGEEVRVVPLSAASEYGTPQQGDAFTLTGVLTVGEGEESGLAGNRVQSWRARLPRGEAELAVDPAAYPAARTIVKGEIIETTAEFRDGARYQVTRVDRGQKGRLVFRLTAI